MHKLINNLFEVLSDNDRLFQCSLAIVRIIGNMIYEKHIYGVFLFMI